MSAQPPFAPFLTEQQKQMLYMSGLRKDPALPMSQNPQMAQPQMSPAQAPPPQPQGVQDDIGAALSAQDLTSIDARRNQRSPGMRTIQKAKAVGPGTALAQSVAALGSNYMTNKANEKAAGGLEKSLQGLRDKEEGIRLDEVATEEELTAEEQRRYNKESALDKRNIESQIADRDRVGPEIGSERSIDEGEETVTYEYMGAKEGWKEIGRGPRWEPDDTTGTGGAADRDGVNNYQGSRIVGKLSDDMRPVMRIQTNLKNIYDVLKPHSIDPATGKAAKGTEIPGVGYGEGGNNFLGTVLRAGRDFFTGTKGQENFNRVSSITNEIIRERAGLTQSQGEMRRVLEELALSGFQGESGLLNALGRIEEASFKDTQNIFAKYGSTPNLRDDWSKDFDVDPFSYMPTDMQFEQREGAPQPGMPTPIRQAAGNQGGVGGFTVPTGPSVPASEKDIDLMSEDELDEYLASRPE